MKRPVVILFAQLTPPLACVASALAALGLEIRYLKLSSALCNEESFTALERNGVQQIDFSKLSGFGPYDIHKVHARISADLLKALFAPRARSRLTAFFPPVGGGDAKLNAVFYEQIAAQLEPDAAVITVGEHLQKTGATIRVWSAGNLFSARAFGTHTTLKTVVPTALVGFVMVMKQALSQGIARWRRLQRKKPAPQIEQVGDTPPVDAEVLFFPHHGPTYGGLMLKDQYYAQDAASDFARERMCHVELADYVPGAVQASVRATYHDLGIEPYFFAQAPNALSMGELLHTVRQCMRDGLSLLAALAVVRVRQRILSGVSALAVFPNARVALLGYEYLFPRWLAYALQARGLRVAASQERLMQAFLPPWPLILDTYFVQGEKAAAALKANPLACVDDMVVSGDVRADLMEVNSQGDVLPAGFEHTTLVLDWHSDHDPYVDRIKPTNSWANNRDFYEAVLQLAQAFPKTGFVIRGKDTAWLKVDALAGIRDQLLAQQNVVISQEYAKPHVSNVLVAAADSIVARYTSLGDQALAAGKPVIYADWLVNGSGCIETICDFSPYPVLARSRDDLLSMYALVHKTGRVMDEHLQQQMAREYANRYPGAPRARAVVRDLLDAMLEQSRSAH